jgi:hypothetical protein
MLAPVYPARVPKGEVLNDAGKRNSTHLTKQVDVIDHKAEGEDRVAELLNSLLKKQIKPMRS